MSQSVSDVVVWDACRLLVCVFNDVRRSFAAHEDRLELDLKAILGAVEERGIAVLCTDLPAVCKHLDKCLDSGRWVHTTLPFSARGEDGTEYPRLLGCLFSYVFDNGGLLRKDYSHEALTCLRQILRCCKKFRIECSQERTNNEVVSFLETELSLPTPSEYWSRPETSFEEVETLFPGFAWAEHYASKAAEVGVSQAVLPFETFLKLTSDFLVTLDKVCGRIAALFCKVEPTDWSHKHGPGAVSVAPERKDKYAFQNWCYRLDSAFPMSDHAFPAYKHWAAHFRDLRRVVTSEERSSRMCAVPKTFEKPRLIAAEPVEHMWCQQFMRDCMYSTIEESWLGRFIPIRDQNFSRQTCLKASETGRLATMDLSEASDRVSCEFVGNFFRAAPRFLNCLRASRTLTCYISKALSGAEADATVALRKYATMGNATTFPVESLGFLAVAIAAVLTQRRLRVTAKNIDSLVGDVAVYGDDLIVPVESAEFLMLALEVLDFKVNHNKTFTQGNFRESCGMEAFNGQEVTTVMLALPPHGDKPNLETVDAAVDVSNNLYERCWYVTAEYIRERVRDYFNIPYVAFGMGTKGFWCRGKLPDPTLTYKVRWNWALHRAEALVTTLYGTDDRTPRPDYLGDLNLLQYFTERPAPDTKWSAGRCSSRAWTKVQTKWIPISDLGYDVTMTWFLGHDTSPAGKRLGMCYIGVTPGVMRMGPSTA